MIEWRGSLISIRKVLTVILVIVILLVILINNKINNRMKISSKNIIIVWLQIITKIMINILIIFKVIETITIKNNHNNRNSNGNKYK